MISGIPIISPCYNLIFLFAFLVQSYASVSRIYAQILFP